MSSSNNEFLLNYFKKGITSDDKNIAHCILFWGNDIDNQFAIATEVARILNCKHGGAEDCLCLNCKWIREHTHPAVLTYSRKDNKPSDDETKNVISIAQARKIRNDLSVTSEYHRVIIFCDKDDDGNLRGLNSTNFSVDAANALLKTFEEPPTNTTFFFLTKDISDMISTVVSRSQCFFVPSEKDEQQNFELVKDLMENYLEIEKNDVLDFNDRLLNLMREHGNETVFTQIENYLVNLLKSNLDNKHLKIKLLKDLKSVEKAKRENSLGMQEPIVAENLAFDLIL